MICPGSSCQSLSYARVQCFGHPAQTGAQCHVRKVLDLSEGNDVMTISLPCFIRCCCRSIRCFRFFDCFQLGHLKCLGSDPSRFALTRGASSSSDRRPTTSDQHLRPSLDIFLISLQVEKDGASQLKGTAFPCFGNTHKITALGTEPVQYAFVSNLKVLLN